MTSQSLYTAAAGLKARGPACGRLPCAARGAGRALALHFATWIASLRLKRLQVSVEVGALPTVRGNRSVKKGDMVHNGWLPKMEIDPQTYAVRADGQLLTCEPASVLPMAQRYFLF